jgi:c-di-GMP-binding flagellar brake protein YcgR
MLIGDIPLGSFVTLELERQGTIYTLQSKVVDTTDTEIVIALPQLDGINFRLLDRDKIAVLAKIDTYLYRWECNEYSSVTEGVAAFVRLTCLEAGERYNRRMAFRIPIDVKAQASRNDSNKSFEISIGNISYLGVGFSSYEELNVKDKIQFTFIEEGWEFPLTVVIVRREKPKVKGYKEFYGSTIIVSNRDLSKYIARKQLESVRKNRNI